MTALMAFVVVIIIVALIFDYVNGFHDAANSIATVVSTRVLSPARLSYGQRSLIYCFCGIRNRGCLDHRQRHAQSAIDW